MAHIQRSHGLLGSSQVAHNCPDVPMRHQPVRRLIGQPAARKQNLSYIFTCRVHAETQHHAVEQPSMLQPGQYSLAQQLWHSSATSRKQRVRDHICCQAADAAVSADVQALTQQQYSSNGLDLQEPSQQQSSSQVIEIEPESSKGPSRLDLIIRTAATADVQAVANLRAEAYYSEDHSRFAQSFKKQFAAQEAESLRQRTASSNGRPQLCECLVALQPGSGEVLGSIDIRLPQSATDMRPIGVPEDDSRGCYLLNVVVDEARRGEGIGKALMHTAMARAVHAWGAERLYTHVEADNEVACGLYKGCGFHEHSSESKYANTSTLGRLVLLMAVAADVPALSDTLWAAPGSQ